MKQHRREEAGKRLHALEMLRHEVEINHRFVDIWGNDTSRLYGLPEIKEEHWDE